jgi:circadian clock protein KaiC
MLRTGRTSLKRLPIPSEEGPDKALTGIAGFDAITGGGLPAARTTLLVGGSGSGKTIFALQFLVHGAKHLSEPGIFVAFEEDSKRIVVNAASFGWQLRRLTERRLFFVDAQPPPELIRSGSFDLDGMFAVLAARARQMRARRIVFDAFDVVLALLPDVDARRRETLRLHAWLMANNLTGIITSKAEAEDSRIPGYLPFGFLQFMVDCTVVLSHCVVNGVSQRNLRVQKYRGSGFDEDEMPFLIGTHGFEVVSDRMSEEARRGVSIERVSCGVKRIDTMLGGGYFRGASILITGSPGTAKTTLSGAITEAACRRGERTMFISFDSDCDEVVRNLASVGCRLGPHVRSGVLRMISARRIAGSAETYLLRIKSLAIEHRASLLIIDPVSTWSRSEQQSTDYSVTERLIDWAKSAGVTLVCTKLLDQMFVPDGNGSNLRVPTLADTWIHLSYVVQAGERNRGLSIIKSRGTAHSNQVRELILSAEGVTLADAYTANGEVLMGTMRWEKERVEQASRESASAAKALRQIQLDAEHTDLQAELKSLKAKLQAKDAEKSLSVSAADARKSDLTRDRSRMRQLRGADGPVGQRK